MAAERSVIIISGGSRGLGQALVTDLLEAGNIVATFSRSPTPFIEQNLKKDPKAKHFFWEAVDGMDFHRVRDFAMSVFQRYKRINVLINNVGTGTEGILTLMSDTDIHNVITLNLESIIHLSRTCLKSMLMQRSGCIINISSVNAIRGHAGISVYSATKAALDGLTRSLAREVGSEGIRVNSVAPGYFESEMTSDLTDAQRARIIRRTPLNRIGTIKDLAGVIHFLISPAASFITGQTLVVDGGVTC